MPPASLSPDKLARVSQLTKAVTEEVGRAFIGAPAITAGGLLLLLLASPVLLHFWGRQLDLTLADPLALPR